MRTCITFASVLILTCLCSEAETNTSSVVVTRNAAQKITMAKKARVPRSVSFKRAQSSSPVSSSKSQKVYVGETSARVTGTSYAAYAKNRRYCVRRDSTTLPGYVITEWYRDGKPDYILPSVVTNAVRNIVGKEQNNPIQNDLEKTAAVAKQLWDAYTNQLYQTTAYSNAYVVAERTAAIATAKIQDEISDLEAKIAKYKEYQTKYPIVKSLFAAMIADAENRIKILQELTGSGS